jgi:hypothetical protein
MALLLHAEPDAGRGDRAAVYITDPFEGSAAGSAHGQTVIAQWISTAIEQFLQPSPTSASSAAS